MTIRPHAGIRCCKTHALIAELARRGYQEPHAVQTIKLKRDEVERVELTMTKNAGVAVVVKRNGHALTFDVPGYIKWSKANRESLVKARAARASKRAAGVNGKQPEQAEAQAEPVTWVCTLCSFATSNEQAAQQHAEQTHHGVKHV